MEVNVDRFSTGISFHLPVDVGFTQNLPMVILRFSLRSKVNSAKNLKGLNGEQFGSFETLHGADPGAERRVQSDMAGAGCVSPLMEDFV
jgi:hypothetical protein